MPSSPLESTHGATTSGMACHHIPWTANTVERCLAWLDFTTLGIHARLDDVRRGMTSSPLDSTHGWQRRVLHYITALGLHARADDVGSGMTSPPLDSTHGRMTSGEACRHRLWTAHTVGLRRAWHDITPLDNTHRRTTSGVEWHHRPWAAHTVGLRRAWYDITAFGQHT